MKYFYIIIITAFLSLPVLSSGSTEGELDYEFIQECKLAQGLLNDFYINKVKKEAIKFLHVFKEYLEKNCE